MKHIIPLIFFTVATMVCSSVTFPHLDNDLIQKFDDKKIGHSNVGIDGALIHDMLWVIDTINGIQHGSPRHTTTRSVKKYDFAHELVTLEHLVALEEKADRSRAVDLHETLQVIKADFSNIVTHFMQQLVIKTVVCGAIDEWCGKSNRLDSLLKLWGSTNKEEFEAIYHKITSAATLNQFLTDLKGFLTDVINSCPRALHEFLERQDEYAAQTVQKNHNA